MTAATCRLSAQSSGENHDDQNNKVASAEPPPPRSSDAVWKPIPLFQTGCPETSVCRMAAQFLHAQRGLRNPVPLHFGWSTQAQLAY